MSDTTYNGWTNYETWNVSLWLSNDYDTYQTVREATEEMAGRIDDDFTAADARYELADWLKAYVEDLAEDTCPGVISGASFVADMFGAALSEVNWDEIASNDLDDIISEAS